MKRALTLVEVLLSLTLLSSLFLVTASWTGLMRTCQDAANETDTEHVLRSVLRLIHDDVMIGDDTENGSLATETPSGL
ncbi:MAG: hypothetical protein HKN91_04445, partial [Acidimicrobiia bacterium]|nr:hypothetical protein [Acidimicrobiia bacterium]